MNESLCTILKVDVICDVALTSTSNVLMTEIRDVLYNQCIDNIVICFFIYPTGRIRVCKIKFVGTGEHLKTLLGMQEKSV